MPYIFSMLEIIFSVLKLYCLHDSRKYAMFAIGMCYVHVKNYFLYKLEALLYKFWLPYPTTNILVYLTSYTDNIPDIPKIQELFLTMNEISTHQVPINSKVHFSRIYLENII